MRALILAAMVAGTPALAHGPDYAWIMNEPRYVDRVGIHCCSTDCFPIDASRLYEEQDGIIFDGGEKLFYRTPEGRNGGIYQSAEPNPPDNRRPWVCRRHGKLKCIFRVVPEI